MASASYAQTSFLGGEISKTAQGRFDREQYRTSLNVCLNGFPIENGSWTRRPGFQYGQTTRNGQPAKLVKFDVVANQAINLEFTSGFLRFRSAGGPLVTNDGRVVLGISTANPAVVQTSGANGWSTGNQVYFPATGLSQGIIENRVLLITVVDSTHFSLSDPLTGAPIDGSQIVNLPSTVLRVMELTTVYGPASISNIRSIQADTNAVLVNGQLAPQMLSMLTPYSGGLSPTFSIGNAAFVDGPYLDPIGGGALITPSATSGIITLIVSFPPYNSSQVYKIGDFVNSAGINYKSLIDQNVGNTPAGSPSAWLAVSAGAAVGPNGFLGTDIGRMIRLYSQPLAWSASTAYVAGNVVLYNGVAYTALASSTGSQPGIDLSKWAINATGQSWTWGKITSLPTQISNPGGGLITGGAPMGNMTLNGGIAAASDGNTSKLFSGCAAIANATTTTVGGETIRTANVGYVGINVSGVAAQQVDHAVIWPSADFGFDSTTTDPGGAVVFNLRGSVGAPASSSNGTLLGSSGSIPWNSLAPVTIISNDKTDAWNYIWIEMIPNVAWPTWAMGIAQTQFFNPTGTGSGTQVKFAVLGPPLLYTGAISVWRMGLYSATTGWPSCGTYHEGRIWLSGVVPNRLDASIPNTLNPTMGAPQYLNFAPTQSDGTVTPANGISYYFDASDVNQIYWMEPDLQGIICGTAAGEWLVQATSPNAAMAPGALQAHRVTKIRCANIEPRRADHTILMVQLFGRKVHEYFTDVYSGKLSGPNISMWARHLTAPGIAELAYQQELAPILWVRNADGSLIGCTYRRNVLSTAQEPNFMGWHRHTLGSGRIIESMAVGAILGSAATLMVVTNDPATNIRHVEMMNPIFEEGNSLSQAWFLDNSVPPTSTQAASVVVSNPPAATDRPYGGLTFNGLWHLNGKTVSVYAGGLDCGDYPVSNGSLTVPYGDGVSAGTANGLFTAAFVASFNGAMPAVIGFTYNSDGQLVRAIAPAESGARTGPALGKRRRTNKFAALLNSAITQTISFGMDFLHLRQATLVDQDDNQVDQLTLYSDVFWDNPDDENNFDSMLCWRISRPLPGNIAALSGFLNTEDA